MKLTSARHAHLVLSLLIAAALGALLWNGIDLAATHPLLAALALALFGVNAIWLSAAAVTSLQGMCATGQDRAEPLVAPSIDRCAILWLVCGEPPEPLARRIAALLAGLDATDQAADCAVFVLSDTQGADRVAQEQAALAPLAHRITWRNRSSATDRKPGNLCDWHERHGADFATMLVLDADSGFSAARLARMRAIMADHPQLGLIQAAISLRPGGSRLSAMQRLSGRLCGPVFARGLARLSSDAGNYWGHNALLRVAAYAQVARLPALSGRPPFGGPILSHDFIEAALMRAAGWRVRIDPEARGSFEDAPESVASHLRRDRRWAQGNLQHLRLIARGGLHPASRLHLLAGIHSYLSAPIWLMLVLLMGSGTVHANAQAVWALLGALGLLMVPKLAGLATLRARLRRSGHRRVLWRAMGAELSLTTLYASVMMIRRTGFVLALLAGRDSGWKPSGQGSSAAGRGRVEQAAGLAILASVIMPQVLISTGTAAVLAAAMVLPVVLPLFAAPWLIRWLDASVSPALDSNAFERSRETSGKRVARAELRPRTTSQPGTAPMPQRDAA
ncbi:glucans biosynthesis glucosyltransferase MdoH [Pararhodobacter sp. SW119]|uniref:glucans biosynthesis glucosyltransferase MdoH n=1 Tax=Pararhodobacter sp. SW119 TaxID=2780075 RepID=UPI001ADF1AD4|nr:glucans biosynthesis glucosyltransferase MdoH [Pararhodobacter sp. SW119]